MRPDERDLDDEIRGHLALSVKERIERGEDPEAARLAALREFGYLPAMRESMRRVWYSRWFDAVAALGRDMRVGTALPPARQGSGRHRRDHARPRHRRQRRDLQRRPRRAAAPARQSRRGSPGLHPAERAGRRHREHDVLDGGVQRYQGARHHHRRLWRFLDHRIHDAWLRRAAAAARRRRRRVVLRGDGPAAGAGPAAECLGRRARCGGRGGADASVLDHLFQQRPVGDRQADPVRAAERRPSSACSNRRCPTRSTPRSSPTW